MAEDTPFNVVLKFRRGTRAAVRLVRLLVPGANLRIWLVGRILRFGAKVTIEKPDVTVGRGAED